ncbi:winged helix-turn-helix transcriptional regulator [Hymenobacter terrenus]|uniref:winged helix-turn-helix transcriptional regulator n=1 Tax=Hymenobacter terrenus TaxID=1629124 RepID=UPI0006190765|nr:helix-turn-helix domain-containing protein [Hymenobacter terrenus]
MRKLTSTNYHNEQQLLTDCPFNFTLSLLAGRWKPAILWKIANGYGRFSGLRKAIPLVSGKVLAEELDELERTGLLARTVFAEMPLRVEYTLTALGASLVPVLEQLKEWADRHR